MLEVRSRQDVALVARVAVEYVRVRRALQRQPLPQVVSRHRPRPVRRRTDPRRLSRAVTKVLGLAQGDKARCIHRALVLHRLLAAQGMSAEVVVGLPEVAVDERAHAWVELDGVDVGPAPGRGQHVPLARYGLGS